MFRVLEDDGQSYADKINPSNLLLYNKYIKYSTKLSITFTTLG
jgi:hypothetical protein